MLYQLSYQGSSAGRGFKSPTQYNTRQRQTSTAVLWHNKLSLSNITHAVPAYQRLTKEKEMVFPFSQKEGKREIHHLNKTHWQFWNDCKNTLQPHHEYSALVTVHLHCSVDYPVVLALLLHHMLSLEVPLELLRRIK